ncbi:hypothetical protein N480_11180 [Pseudoalteromonas luteoviolacea S2607]|nr:hypothetical protein N480_11180 [Pseudoalteromonas luteoviolacea S2607]
MLFLMICKNIVLNHQKTDYAYVFIEVIYFYFFDKPCNWG